MLCCFCAAGWAGLGWDRSIQYIPRTAPSDAHALQCATTRLIFLERSNARTHKSSNVCPSLMLMAPLCLFSFDNKVILCTHASSFCRSFAPLSYQYCVLHLHQSRSSLNYYSTAHCVRTVRRVCVHALSPCRRSSILILGRLQVL